MLYTEGKPDAEVIDGRCPDEIFYETLLKSLAPGVRAKIKCVGNKDAALQYVSLIEESGIRNSFVVVDRDYYGIVCSPIRFRGLIYTFGYSWESDLWTEGTIRLLVENLTANDPRAASLLRSSYEEVERRLKFLATLDLATQVAGCPVLLPKNGGACGINPNGGLPLIISDSEIRRLVRKFRGLSAANCRLSRGIRRKASKESATKVVQGHLWEFFMTSTVFGILKRTLGTSQISKTILRNVALNLLLHSADECLGADRLNHYRENLVERILA